MTGWADQVPQRLRARLGDVGCMLVAVLVGGLATDATAVPGSNYTAVNDLVGLAATGLLWWRRRFPLAVAAATFVAGGLAPLASGAAIVSVYSVAVHARGRPPLALVALYVASGALGVALFPDLELGRLRSVLAGALLTVAALGWGLVARGRARALAELAARAERAEAEQHARVLEARRAERARIAAEMHDVLAHRLSMLSLHAGAIELRPDAPPADLAAAAAVVRQSAHQALEELRAVVGVLRDDDAEGLGPLPGAAALDELVAECRAAGMDVEVVADGVALAALPDELGRHLYRLVQEGLTNARKHAPGRPVRVLLAGRPGGELCVEVANPLGAAPPEAIPGAGVGLVGLRERVEVAGGRFEAGAAGGHHRVRARLPWPT